MCGGSVSEFEIWLGDKLVGLKYCSWEQVCTLQAQGYTVKNILKELL